MVNSSPLMFVRKQIDNWLSAADRFIWQSEQSVDYVSNYFYVFKIFPKELKGKQRIQWAELQQQTLSPFSNCTRYAYLSDAGLHLWISQAQEAGIPETAAQQSLGDGEYLVRGENQQYKQNWQNGIMLKCFAVSSESTQSHDEKSSIHIIKHSSWAVRRKIDEWLQRPSAWIGITAFVSCCALVWLGAASITLHLQGAAAENQIDQLESTLGEKLAEQSKLQQTQQTLSLLKIWHNEYGFLPESLGEVAAILSLQGQWKANVIAWQSKHLEIELLAENIDIAALVSELESIDKLEQVNIRPHAANDTWILEADLK
jgi:hypothetical protein